VNQSRYIDEKDLPFTEDELFRAFALTEDEQVARDAARTLAELLSSGTYEGGWSIADEGFAALALLSEDLRKRVNAYMAARWEGMRWLAVRTALRREGLPPTSKPTSSALRAAEDEIARYVENWRRGCAALAEWVGRRQAGEPVADEPPPWPGEDEDYGGALTPEG
jgi:cytosine/adenosine deaminase-related metal-dependent hydrolase